MTRPFSFHPVVVEMAEKSHSIALGKKEDQVSEPITKYEWKSPINGETYVAVDNPDTSSVFDYEILRLASRERRLVELLREALDVINDYADHMPGCDRPHGENYRCRCNWVLQQEVIEKIRKELG